MSDFTWVPGVKEDPCDANQVLSCWRMYVREGDNWARTPYWTGEEKMPTNDARLIPGQ